jgi:hypothetical protein
MKTSYLINPIHISAAFKSGFLALVIICSGLILTAQQSGAVRVANDKQLLDAVKNPGVKTMFVEPGYYASVDRQLGPGMKIIKPENPDGNREFQCVYAIQQSIVCFDPVPPETYVSSIASASTMDLFGCGCCPPPNAGTWSVISGPGNIIIDSPTDEYTTFSVNAPGAYTLRYTWPAPWNSFVETVYLFYISYTANIQADDACGLTTNVHFEYTTVEADPGVTLEWLLNGAPYDGPGVIPGGDTVDFELTVPYCGEWIIQATLTPTNCDPVTVSDTIHLKGNSGPEIAGVGPDTTIICPDIPVFSEPTVYDPCDPDATLDFETDSIPGDCPDHYTLIRTWTATNECGFTSTASQTIIHLPNPNPEILLLNASREVEDTMTAGCDEEVTIPFPEIITPCGAAEVFYARSDGGAWEDPFEPGTTEVCYWGISPCGFSTDTLCIYVLIGPCDDSQFCSLTQGFYGNPGGTFCNGMGTAELIESLLAQGNLVVGSGGNTLTFEAGESACIIALLPGGGPAKKITGANTCASHPGIQTKKGKIHNILLAQTITLGLNLRLSGDLGNLNIYSDTLLTAPSSGCDGEGDTITGPYVKRTIPASVYNVLSQNGNITPTVNDLFALANTGLGGGSVGATTLSAISDAASRINEGFDECAFGHFQMPLYLQSMAALGGITPAEEVTSALLKIFPNPFSTTATIEFTAPQNGNALVEIYTLTGQRVAVIYDGKVEEGITYRHTFTGDPGVNQMTYMCVIRTGQETRYERLLMVR